jgi:hypothetical protein
MLAFCRAQGIDALEQGVHHRLSAPNQSHRHYVVGDRGSVTINVHWRHDGEAFNEIAHTGERDSRRSPARSSGHG